MSATDWIRAIVVVLGGGTLGSTVTVLALYFVAWARNRHAGLLPLHVWSIALSYLVLLTTFGLVLFNRIGENAPLTGYIFAYGVACMIGIFSMVTIGAKQYARLTRPQEVP